MQTAAHQLRSASLRALPAALGAWLALAPGLATATWSIAVFDEESREVVVAAATCVANVDLRAVLPVVRTGIGAGVAQASVDGTGSRRALINQGLIDGIGPAAIAAQLQALPGAASTQHGIVVSGFPSVTLTGSSTLRDAGGVIGSVGTLRYAIQGNLLVAPAVWLNAEQSLRASSGLLALRVQDAMEAARAAGGDARCSCTSWNSQVGCAQLIPDFPKAAHTGFLLVAREGETDDPNCNANGCADGAYWLSLNVANQPVTALDPVLQLRSALQQTLVAREGRLDALGSKVEFERDPAGLRIRPRDWRGAGLAVPVTDVRVELLPGTDVQVGAAEFAGDGSIRVPLAAINSDTLAFRIALDSEGSTVRLPTSRTRFPSMLVDGFE